MLVNSRRRQSRSRGRVRCSVGEASGSRPASRSNTGARLGTSRAAPLGLLALGGETRDSVLVSRRSEDGGTQEDVLVLLHVRAGFAVLTNLVHDGSNVVSRRTAGEGDEGQNLLGDSPAHKVPWVHGQLILLIEDAKVRDLAGQAVHDLLLAEAIVGEVVLGHELVGVISGIRAKDVTNAAVLADVVLVKLVNSGDGLVGRIQLETRASLFLEALLLLFLGQVLVQRVPGASPVGAVLGQLGDGGVSQALGANVGGSILAEGVDLIPRGSEHRQNALSRRAILGQVRGRNLSSRHGGPRRQVCLR